MKHTKSKLKVYKGFDRLYLYATQLPGSPRIADIPDTGALAKEECIANAAYMSKCWNKHDELRAKAAYHDDLVDVCTRFRNEINKQAEEGEIDARLIPIWQAATAVLAEVKKQDND